MPTAVPAPDAALDQPLSVPVSAALPWATVQRMSQTPPRCAEPGEAAITAAVRRTATIRRGTTMMKVLTGPQVAGYLGGWQLAGFCYRAYDLAHLRTPQDLALLNGSQDLDEAVVFALRWRAVDPIDYAVPLDAALRPRAPIEVDITGLAGVPPSHRIGPQVLGTGFAPTGRQLIPEWVTADFADLPMPVGTSIVAYTADGSEVVLYTYQPEQHAWLRMCGTQWRHLLSRIPVPGTPGQEYFPVSQEPTRLLGRYRGRMLDAIADPPDDFWVAAKTRTARYPVDALARRTRFVRWRGALCVVVRAEGGWRQLRLCRPDADSVHQLGASSVERGVFETWAPASEATDGGEVDVWYDL
ncbi:MAG: hypothetical protein HKP61_12300 [Dactylosporangium sp.]|nr:hypothetical protein [Dactylosporangium sp.]